MSEIYMHTYIQINMNTYIHTLYTFSGGFAWPIGPNAAADGVHCM